MSDELLEEARDERLRAEARLEAVCCERDQARAEVAKAIEEREALRETVLELQAEGKLFYEDNERANKERYALRAVLAETPENVAAVGDFFRRWYSKSPPWEETDVAARALLADLRARGGMEPAPPGCPRCAAGVCSAHRKPEPTP